MPHSSPFSLSDAQSFRCIGPACEDSGCQGWSVPIDQASYAEYKNLPPSPLHRLMDASMLPMPADAKPACFARRPYILENYLVNNILRCGFPFGSAPAGTPVSMSREFALLTAQFALVKGLLIGVTGFHREAFNAAHVVHTVQAASKHFEHHPEFLHLAYQLLVESRMDGVRGLAILLRNTKSGARRPVLTEISVPAPQEEQPASSPQLLD